jgi:hypothetical protein
VVNNLDKHRENLVTYINNEMYFELTKIVKECKFQIDMLIKSTNDTSNKFNLKRITISIFSKTFNIIFLIIKYSIYIFVSYFVFSKIITLYFD